MAFQMSTVEKEYLLAALKALERVAHEPNGSNAIAALHEGMDWIEAALGKKEFQSTKHPPSPSLWRAGQRSTKDQAPTSKRK
jgi:hypothetical protein